MRSEWAVKCPSLISIKSEQVSKICSTVKCWSHQLTYLLWFWGNHPFWLHVMCACIYHSVRVWDGMNTSYVTFFRSEPSPSLPRGFQRIWLVTWSMLPRRKVSPSLALQRWGFFLITDGSLLVPDQKVEKKAYCNQTDTNCKFWG